MILQKYYKNINFYFQNYNVCNNLSLSGRVTRTVGHRGSIRDPLPTSQ